MECKVTSIKKKVGDPEIKIDLSIWGAPHERSRKVLIDEYRKCIREAFVKAGEKLPISEPVDLGVIFIDPTSPDLDHLHVALYRALDKNVLKDDGLVTNLHHFSKMYVADAPRK